MDNSKRSVHNTGPLGMLVRSGHIKQIENEEQFGQDKPQADSTKGIGSYFRTQTGIEFNENELVHIDPTQCEPWKYANRLSGNMGEIDELVKSIKDNKQLQPALIRPHPKPHGSIKFEVIFGRRRHEACLRLGIPFLAIKKNISDIREAIAFQEAENRSRQDVSNYSNAMLYKRLLNDGVFINEKDISEKLGISLSKVYDIMAYAKISEDVIKLIPDVHNLSNHLALKIAGILKESPEMKTRLISIAPEIGKSITSPVKLEKSLYSTKRDGQFIEKAKIYKSIKGKKLFTFKLNHRGSPCIEIQKENSRLINYENLCQYLKTYLEKMEKESEALV